MPEINWDSKVSVSKIEIRGFREDPHTREFPALESKVTARQVASDVWDQLSPETGVVIGCNRVEEMISLVGYEADQKLLILELKHPMEPLRS